MIITAFIAGLVTIIIYELRRCQLNRRFLKRLEEIEKKEKWIKNELDEVIKVVNARR